MRPRQPFRPVTRCVGLDESPNVARSVETVREMRPPAAVSTLEPVLNWGAPPPGEGDAPPAAVSTRQNLGRATTRGSRSVRAPGFGDGLAAGKTRAGALPSFRQPWWGERPAASATDERVSPRGGRPPVAAFPRSPPRFGSIAFSNSRLGIDAIRSASFCWCGERPAASATDWRGDNCGRAPAPNCFGPVLPFSIAFSSSPHRRIARLLLA
jgi:hypothetical protein